jgi:hypothetical protein
MNCCKKIKNLRVNTCFGISLSDGVHGIVVWDGLYALFMTTTTMSMLLKQVETGRTKQSITDIVTSGLLAVRAVVGISTCLRQFALKRVKFYLFMRLLWDFCLVLFKLIMAGLREIDTVSFFGNIFVLVVIEGYLNFVIYSHLTKELAPVEQ